MRSLLDNEPSFHDNADGLVIKHEQAITSDFVDSLKAERNAKAGKRSGEFERFASVPTFVVEMWGRQGRDWQNAAPKEIVKWLKADGLDHFICGKA
jgi:hypothetical protein